MDLKNGNILLTREDVLKIPERLMPMIVFSDNLRSFFSTAIKEHCEGSYNHAMWLIRPGVIASQNYLFQAQPVTDYFDSFRLKFWHCPGWTKKQRTQIINAIDDELARPWYTRMYDYLAIVGQAIGIDSLQTPGIDICSDKGKYLKLVDRSYDLAHPAPEDVNRWLMAKKQYEVYGRYLPD